MEFGLWWGGVREMEMGGCHVRCEGRGLACFDRQAEHSQHWQLQSLRSPLPRHPTKLVESALEELDYVI